MLSRWREPRELKYEKTSQSRPMVNLSRGEPALLTRDPIRPSQFKPTVPLMDLPHDDQIVRTTPWEVWKPVYPLPNVILVTDRATANLDSGLMALHWPEDLGYLFLERVPWIRGGRYVRGRWLWWLHRAGGWLWRRSRVLAFLGVAEGHTPRF